MAVQLVLSGILLLCLCEVCAATDCPDAGVVVVASVFATLAVVFLILGTIAFVLWKKKRGRSTFPYKCTQLFTILILY